MHGCECFVRVRIPRAAWRAPETFGSGGRQVFTTATDVYMFGCFLLEAMTLRNPWWWFHNEELLVHRAITGASPLTDARTGGRLSYVVAPSPATAVLEGVMEACLALVPESRPDMASVVASLHSALAAIEPPPPARVMPAGGVPDDADYNHFHESPVHVCPPVIPAISTVSSTPTPTSPIGAFTPQYTRCVRQYDTGLPRYNVGLAITADETRMVVVNKDRVTVFALPDGTATLTLSRKGAGPGEFKDSRGVCVTPWDTMLIAEDHNQRISEVGLTGGFVRFLCEGVGSLEAIATDGVFVVAGRDIRPSPHRLLLLDAVSGKLLRSFAGYGSGRGDMGWCGGVAFSGDRIVAADSDNQRVAVWTTGGELVACVTVGDVTWPAGVAVGHDGRVAVVDREGGSPVRVYTPDLTALINTVPVGDALSAPRCAAIVGSSLYVLDKMSPTVVVYQ